MSYLVLNTRCSGFRVRTLIKKTQKIAKKKSTIDYETTIKRLSKFDFRLSTIDYGPATMKFSRGSTTIRGSQAGSLEFLRGVTPWDASKTPGFLPGPLVGPVPPGSLAGILAPGREKIPAAGHLGPLTG